MSFSESCRVLFKHKDYDVLIAVKIFLPSLHSLAGNRNVTKDDTAAPFTVRMAHQWQGCFPWEPSNSPAETGGAAGVGTGGKPCAVFAALCLGSLLSAFPLLILSFHRYTLCRFWPHHVTATPKASDRAQNMPGIKSLLLQLLNTNDSGEDYFAFF